MFPSFLSLCLHTSRLKPIWAKAFFFHFVAASIESTRPQEPIKSSMGFHTLVIISNSWAQVSSSSSISKNASVNFSISSTLYLKYIDDLFHFPWSFESLKTDLGRRSYDTNHATLKYVNLAFIKLHFRVFSSIAPFYLKYHHLNSFYA